MEGDAEEYHLKAEEHAQQMKLLEVLQEGKISREMYKSIKPKGF